MLVSFKDLLVAQERHQDLLVEVEARRAAASVAGHRRQGFVERLSGFTFETMHRFGRQLVSTGETLQRHYAN